VLVLSLVLQVVCNNVLEALTFHLFWTLQEGVAKHQDHVVFVAHSKGVGKECGEKSLRSSFASGGSEGDYTSYVHYQWEQG
jgi:hypothetical protein